MYFDLTTVKTATRGFIGGPLIAELAGIISSSIKTPNMMHPNDINEASVKTLSNANAQTPVPVATVQRALLIMSKYSKAISQRFGKDLGNLSNQLDKLYLSEAGHGRIQSVGRTVEYIGMDQGGKRHLFNIPGVDNMVAADLYKTVAALLEKWKTSEDPRKAKFANPDQPGQNPVTKVYQREMSIYSIHQNFVTFIAEILKKHSYNVKDMERTFGTPTPPATPAQDQTSQAQPAAAAPAPAAAPQGKNLDAVMDGNVTQKGWKLSIMIQGEPEIRAKIKTAPSWKWNGQTDKKWVISGVDVDWYTNPDTGLIPLLDKNGYDTTKIKQMLQMSPEDKAKLDAIKKEQDAAPKTPAGKKPLKFVDIGAITGGFFKIAIQTTNRLDFKEVAEFAKNTFPEHVQIYSNANFQLMRSLQSMKASVNGRVQANIDADKKVIDEAKAMNKGIAYRTVSAVQNLPFLPAMPISDSLVICLNGNMSDFCNLERVLSLVNYETKGFRDIAAKYIQSGDIDQDEVIGRLDGYTKSDDIWARDNDIDKFRADIDASVNANLYDAQKDGVEFLYGRKAAILGDDTGAGKTLQMITAAGLRMQQNGGRTLIITLHATKKQWANEIKKFVKGSEGHIAFDPTSGAKWVVMHYQEFGNGAKVKQNKKDPNEVGVAKRDLLADAIINQGNFTCLIIDEVHNIKNPKAWQSQIIEKIAKKIPYIWGASATFVANTPIDVYNQLAVIGHRLGQLSEDHFKEQFCGYSYKKNKTRKGGRMSIQDPEKAREGAANLRKWLMLGGAYIKRTKRDMNPNLPTNTISQNPVDIDLKALERDIAKRMSGYKNPEHALSELTAARAQIAVAKVPFTVELAKNVLQQGKKVVIFSCFPGDEPGSNRPGAIKLLKASLQEDYLYKLPEDEAGYVGEYHGQISMDERQRALEDFKNPKSKCKVLLIGTLAGGTGIDLPNVVEDVIMNDFSWTPKDAEQSEGRAFRVTSLTDVNTRYVIADNSIDSELYEYVQAKIKLAALIQNLRNEENQLITKGDMSGIKDIQAKIRGGEDDDTSLDQTLMGYIRGFLGTMNTKGQDRQASGWYNKIQK